MTIQELRKQRDAEMANLLAKVKRRDWHGVADAAMDLRELEAKLDVCRLASLDFIPEGEQGH